MRWVVHSLHRDSNSLTRFTEEALLSCNWLEIKNVNGGCARCPEKNNLGVHSASRGDLLERESIAEEGIEVDVAFSSAKT